MKLLRWLFSAKHYEIKIALATLAVLLMLPVFVFIVFASSGLSLIASALTDSNPQTQTVTIFDPNGHQLTELKLSTVWPVRGYVSDEFGAWEDWRKALGLGPHTGIDIANQYGLPGDPITPFMEGKVTAVHYKDDNTCGIWIRVQHDYHISSLYCHLSAPVAVVGQEVKPGDIIALEGQSGEATGPHVHFQVEVYGVPVNPRNFVAGEPQRNLPRGLH